MSMSPADQLVQDFEAAIERLVAKPIMDFEQLNSELRNNVYPSMMALAEQVSEVDGVIQEVVEQQDSYVTDDLGGQILGVFATALILAEEIEKLSLDDLNKKKLGEIIKHLRETAQQAAAYLHEAMGSSVMEEGEGEDDAEEEEDQDG